MRTRPLAATIGAVAVLLLPAVANAAADTASPQVISGSPTADGAFPFVVALVDAATPNAAEGQFCGGSLIARDLVVTAAHCVAGARPDEIDVVVGRRVLSSSAGQRIHAQAVSFNPAYTDDGLRSDVGLIRLAMPAAPPAAPVPLASAADVARTVAGQPAVVVGWGVSRRTDVGDVLPDDLRRGDVVMTSDASCARDVGRSFDPRTMICASPGPSGQGPCNGDSGGPLLISDGAGGYRIAGLVSWGLKCASTISPTVFARVSALRGYALSAPPAAPQVQRLPQVLGLVAVGRTVRCVERVRGTRLRFRYRWNVDFGAIPGVVGATYRVRADDEGRLLSCSATVANGGGTIGPLDSDTSLVAERPPPPDHFAPRIRGIRVVCTNDLGSRQRECAIAVNVRDRGASGVVRVEVVVDRRFDGRRTTRILDASPTADEAEWELPIRFAAGTYTIIARAFDGAGNRTRRPARLRVVAR